MDVVAVWNSLFLYGLHNNSRAIWSLVYQPGYLSYPDYRIFTGEISTSVSSFLSASNFLIAIRLASGSAPIDFYTPGRDGSLGSTFPEIFHLLQSIHSEFLLRFPGDPGESMYHTLEIIIKWLQVSVSECNRQTPQTKKSNLYLPGTWFRATE